MRLKMRTPVENYIICLQYPAPISRIITTMMALYLTRVGQKSATGGWTGFN
jgi:hypothetical protein